MHPLSIMFLCDSTVILFMCVIYIVIEHFTFQGGPGETGVPGAVGPPGPSVSARSLLFAHP